MTDLLTSAQMRGIERAAIESGTITGLRLMERAGRGALARAFEYWPDLPAGPRQALVLCGPGNNGGDGYVIARLLHDRGWHVQLHALATPGQGAPDAARNHALWLERGTVGPLRAGEVAQAVERAEELLVVDAVFGTGLQRPLGAKLAAALAATRPARWRLAVDAPSGLCLDSGRTLVEGGAALPLPARLTVSFHAPKLGHYLDAGPAACGALALVDIGLGQAPSPEAVQLARPDPAAIDKAVRAHKYGHGHLLVLAGGVGKGGAARMAARAALRVGAGLVTLAPPPAALIENAARLDAVMLRPVGAAETLAEALGDARLNALCLGPGLGLERARALVPEALRARRPTVLDADALTAFAEAPGTLFKALHPDCLLTPHDGEFARLFPDIAADLAASPARGPAMSRVDAVRAAAARAGCAVLLKGPDTVIAEPGGQTVLNAACYGRAAPWLATAGAGDVLSGLIAGLLARGFAPLPAAETAAWLHVETGRAIGPGLIAEDLPEALPGVLRGLISPRP
ncbi:NAD(P)H-hydrate dehydratase [Alkalilacustris brevis]|uniref:NAD(P)H-hydrate dehydratase n=1 Tax=Alkalilacustris brevis TaxID=2026338 RepID=UPI000E0DC6C3|nr:NAD(P)H-hydrate dehydratase [Alkalilacustris brevis]